jgi:hypothetical protein
MPAENESHLGAQRSGADGVLKRGDHTDTVPIGIRGGKEENGEAGLSFTTSTAKVVRGESLLPA